MLLYEGLSNQIVGGFIRVHRELGMGLLESCYHNALYFELKEQGLSVAYIMRLSMCFTRVSR